jgi:hypothetical protein
MFFLTNLNDMTFPPRFEEFFPFNLKRASHSIHTLSFYLKNQSSHHQSSPHNQLMIRFTSLPSLFKSINHEELEVAEDNLTVNSQLGLLMLNSFSELLEVEL